MNITPSRLRALAAVMTLAAVLPLSALAADAEKPAEPPKTDAAKPNGARANDFPTQSRVEWVLQCMGTREGVAVQELIYKCVCAIDEIAARVSHDDFVSLSTFANAFTIAGERGAVLRERPDAREMSARYKELIGASEKACFLKPVK